MKVHHLNLCTMCPIGGRLVSGEAGRAPEQVVHVLVIEHPTAGLVLADTGYGLDDVRDPRGRLGAGLLAMSRPRLVPEDTAIRQIEALGFTARDVRHILVTHLDPDHAGGLPDFPEAEVHVHRREHDAAAARATINEKMRYRPAHLAHGPRWALHEAEGERWEGFESVRAIADDVLLVPLFGHTRGHSAIAVRAANGRGAEWQVLAGDAYFFRGELDDPPTCPSGLARFQSLMAVDDAARVENTRRLRALVKDARGRVDVFSSHDAEELRARVTRTTA